MEYRPLNRDEEIREKAHILLEELLELYVLTASTNAYNGELDKTEHARAAMGVFWELFDLLGTWAQSHLAAQARIQVDESFVDHLMHEYPDVHLDSYFLERYGYDFLRSLGANFEDDGTNFFTDEKEHMTEKGLREQITRAFFFEIFSSASEFSHAWRYPLQRSVRALNDGQIDDLFKPMPGRRGGAKFDLNQWKLEALLQVHFRMGKGYKKYRALEEVATGIGQSVETLRYWEKALKLDTDYFNELRFANIAGEKIADIRSGNDLTIGDETYGTYRGKPVMGIVRDLLPVLENRTLHEIMENIRRFRAG